MLINSLQKFEFTVTKTDFYQFAFIFVIQMEGKSMQVYWPNLNSRASYPY